MSDTAPLTHLIAEGRQCSVECVVWENGNSPAKKFLEEECEKLRRTGTTAHVKMLVLFQSMADNGALSEKRFKTEMAKLCAFRLEFGGKQIRFPCFLDGNKWIVTHGFFKPGAKKGLGAWPEKEVTRANELRDEYFRRKQNKKKTSDGKITS